MIERKNDTSRNLEKALQEMEQAKEMLMLARQELYSAQYAKIKSTAVSDVVS